MERLRHVDRLGHVERRVGVNKLVVYLLQRRKANRRHQDHAGQGRTHLQNYQKGNLKNVFLKIRAKSPSYIYNRAQYFYTREFNAG